MTNRHRELSPQELEQMTEIFQRQFNGETLTAICKDLGIDRKTFYRRRQHPSWAKLEKELSERLIDNAYEDIMKTVILEAKKGSVPAAKLFMDVTGRIKSTKEVRENEELKRLNSSTSPMDLEALKRLVEEDKKIRRIK
jgi:hypothetical protein